MKKVFNFWNLNKPNQILAILMLVFLSCISSSINAQTFVEYTIDGINYKATGEQIMSSSSKELDSNGKHISNSLGITTTGIAIDLNFSIYLTPENNFSKGTYKFGAYEANLKTLPICFLMTTKNLKDGYVDIYNTVNNSEGSFKITKVTQEYIEGTFETVCPSEKHADTKAPLKITNGKFKVTYEEI